MTIFLYYFAVATIISSLVLASVSYFVSQYFGAETTDKAYGQDQFVANTNFWRRSIELLNSLSPGYLFGQALYISICIIIFAVIVVMPPLHISKLGELVNAVIPYAAPRGLGIGSIDYLQIVPLFIFTVFAADVVISGVIGFVRSILNRDETKSFGTTRFARHRLHKKG